MCLFCSFLFQKIKTITQKQAHLVAHSSASIIALDIMLKNQKSNSLSLPLTIMNGYSYLLKVINKDTKSTDVDILCDFVENYVPSARIRVSAIIIPLVFTGIVFCMGKNKFFLFFLF